MPLADRILMGPGPCNPCPEATTALARPPGHRRRDVTLLLGALAEVLDQR